MLSIDAWLDEKPYKELYDGVVHEKVSPQLDHGRVAAQLIVLLAAWAGERGDVVPELRVYLSHGTTLVPDVSFVSRKRLAPLSKAQTQKPPFAPDIVVEVRSPDDREANIRRKTELYLAHGARIVLNVDPEKREVRMSDAASESVLRCGDIVEHPAFSDLQIPVAQMFATLDRKM
jgi:Uma2 family endonuclease